MTFEFLGHATIRIISADGTCLIVDPYDPDALRGAIGFGPITQSADFVVCSHDHADHSGVSHVPGAPVVIDRGPAGPFQIDRYPIAHDEYEGARFGGVVDVLRITVDDRIYVHLSDVGRSPDATIVEACFRADVLFIPVGGFYTIGAAQAVEWARALSPRTVVPIHCQNVDVALPLHNLDAFGSQFEGAWESRAPMNARS